MKICSSLAFLVLSLLLSGCCSVKRLQPAFQANQQNLRDLRVNVVTVMDLLEKSATGLLDTRIELLRGTVADSIITDFSELGFSAGDIHAASVEKLLSNSTNGVGRRFASFRDAMNAASESRRDELRFQFPIFAALLDLRITPQQIAEDYTSLLGARTAPNVRALKKTVTDKYPAVRDLVAARDRFSKSLVAYRNVIIDKQLGLALQHADLFTYAAQGDINIEKAFASVIGDKGLQSQILGAVHDPKAREAVEESFSFATKLFGSDEP
jgi:hypothetical protein